MKKGCSPLWGVLLTLGLWLGCVVPAMAVPLDFFGTWRFRDAKDEPFEEAYTQNYSLGFSQQVTDVISLNESLRYTLDWAEGGNNRELLAPTVALAVNNDIFRLNLSGTATETWQKERPNESVRSVNATWSSVWQRRLWLPDLRLNFDQNRAEDDESPRELDTESRRSGFNADWDLKIAKLVYDFTRQESEDNVELQESTNTRHFARFETGGSFWDDRVRVNFSEQFNDNNQETEIEVGAAGVALIQENPLRDGLFRISTDLPTDSDPVLASNIALNNDDLPTTALTMPGNSTDFLNIGFEIDYNRARQVDVIYIYTDVDIEAVTPGTADFFVWDVYFAATNLPLTTWTLEATGVTSTYNSLEQRFEIEVSGLQSRFIKVVAQPNLPLGTDVNFTEIDAFERRFTSEQTLTLENDITSYLTDFNLGVRIRTDLSFAYSLSLDNRKASLGNDFDSRSQTGSFTWKPNLYLTTVASASEVSQEFRNREENLSRSYGLNVSSTPLPTLDVSFGVTRTDNFKDDDKLTANYNYSLYTTARLFPDLDARMELFYDTFEPEDSDVDTEAYRGRLILTSRLSPSLTSNLEGNYDRTAAAEDTETSSANLDLSWRLSDMLSLQGTALQRWEDEGPDTTSLSFRVSLAPTAKIQLSTTYTVRDSDTTSETTAASLRWALSRSLSLQLNGNYVESKDEGNIWNANGQVNARF